MGEESGQGGRHALEVGRERRQNGGHAVLGGGAVRLLRGVSYVFMLEVFILEVFMLDVRSVYSSNMQHVQ